ncbi:helix-turn-helix domain-containing protein [Roseibium aggregatum]|uniref:helix-turn-helix domain-containing protein n=1 Tax=Roseibium aggregatum TaxID=187304 RepID=UPI0025AD9168|nr:helix-turn-helix domain-containing protein [Roseibium aggregatum]WJS05172.1 helix-turn-helix domain-containing protein [Roseibium aggregatum]
MAKPKQVPLDGWDQHSIMAELHRQGMTLAKLAKAKNRRPGSFSHVWKRPVSIAEEAIAEFLKTPKEKLFPDRYPKRTARILDSKFEDYGASQKAPARPDRKAA